MDFSEQGPPTLGAGTLILPSYEESCDLEDGVATMDVDNTLPATLKLDATITEDNIDPPPKSLKVKRGGSSKRGRGGRRQTSRSKTKASVVESHDLLEEESPDLTATTLDGAKLWTTNQIQFRSSHQKSLPLLKVGVASAKLCSINCRFPQI